MHENRGLNPHIEDIARRLALDNFMAFAPDALFPLGGYPGDEDKARELFPKLDQAKTREDFVAAANWLKARPDCTGRIGAVGFCYGGGIVNMLATRVPDLAAGVPFYGSQPPAADVPKIKAAMLIHYAGVDERINAGWPAYEEALKANKVRVRGLHLSGRAARLQQRHHAALRRGGGEARLGAHRRLVQQVSPHVTPRLTALDDIWSGEPNIVLDGKYRIETLLGQGGMGAVYRATHLGTTRTVAVKIIHPRFSHDPEFVERFRREAEASGPAAPPERRRRDRLRVRADADAGQVAYLVMEYLDGRSLADVLAGGGAAVGGLGRRHPRTGLLGRRRSPPARHRPPRPEARQHLARAEPPRRLHGQGPGLRPRQDWRRRRASPAPLTSVETGRRRT